MSEITIVTAFFDIGKKDFTMMARSNEKYFHDFECWARIQNKLVVYTQPQFKDAIMDIREKFHQRHNTEVIVIDDLLSVDREIYEKYQKIAESGYLEKYKLLQGTLTAIEPKYNLVTLLKFWFIRDAEKRGLIKDFAAWLDFGFGHGNFFANPEEFDFKWDYDFKRKIILFTLHDVDNVPIFEVVRCSLNYVMAGVMIIPKELCETVWEHAREAAFMLTQIGFMDDEQTVMLLAYRNHSEYYEMIPSDWHMGLVTYGGQHLTLSRDVKKEEVVELKGLVGIAAKLFKKSRANRTGIYRIWDSYMNFKMSRQKSSLEINCEKFSRDCAERTYEQVYKLYWNDRSH